MALCCTTAYAIDGVTSRRVTVEADVRGRGLPAFNVVGLGDKAVREARDRVRSAIQNCGFKFPEGRITVNLAPAYLRKVGPSFDLPLAMVLLGASGQVDADALAGCALVGELGLLGDVRPVIGALAISEGARRDGVERLFVPRSRAAEAAAIEGVEIVGIESLREAVDVLCGRSDVPPLPAVALAPDDAEAAPDLADVRGHNALIPALEIAAAGGHNLFLHGPPGTGKTMLARRLPGVLPPMTREEAIEVTRIHSVAGHHGAGGLVSQRPFRAPHHTISASGLVGGGSTPTPGEVTLAHNGVLFMDELNEFNRRALESLRQPLEDGRVAVVRGQRASVYPSRCMLVAAANPCPCGMEGDRCRCSGADLVRHGRRLSGPLMDRLDLTVHVGRPSGEAMRTQGGPSSAEVRARVVAARERQAVRLAGTGVACNGQMSPAIVRELAAVAPGAMRLLYDAYDRSGLSARGQQRVLRVARTVADLEGSDAVEPQHVTAALSWRTDHEFDAAAA